ncbi:MAG TPA: hypothetical protein VNG69_06515 [Casimicrobiaceae bacterium]|nr:hypothetical protein [Casimicrobiaceae bacterium]
MFATRLTHARHLLTATLSATTQKRIHPFGRLAERTHNTVEFAREKSRATINAGSAAGNRAE